MAATVAKPVLRGLVKAYIVRAFLISSSISLFAGWSYKHFVGDARKKRYSDFYVNYNPEAEADRLYKMGLIRSWNDNEDKPEQSLKLPY